MHSTKPEFLHISSAWNIWAQFIFSAAICKYYSIWDFKCWALCFCHCVCACALVSDNQHSAEVLCEQSKQPKLPVAKQWHEKFCVWITVIVLQACVRCRIHLDRSAWHWCKTVCDNFLTERTKVSFSLPLVRNFYYASEVFSVFKFQLFLIRSITETHTPILFHEFWRFHLVHREFEAQIMK